MTLKQFASRVAFAGFASLLGAYFALPMLWLITAPFGSRPSLTVRPSTPTLGNLRSLFVDRTDVLRTEASWPFLQGALWNSTVLVAITIAIVIVACAPAAYVLSRIRFPGRNLFLYLLLLLSSVVTGSAAIVPLFRLMHQLRLINEYHGVALALAGGLLPASIFILKDFTDSIPRSYEESARVFGASSFQAMRHVILPVIRPGVAVIAVWGAVQVWSNFLVPFVLLRDPNKSPAAVLMFTFYDEGGRADLSAISAFSLVFTIPVLLLYWFVNKKYGFRFHGGIKR